MDEDSKTLREKLGKADENIKNLESSLYEVLKIHTDAIVVLNHNGNILFRNLAAEKLLGREPETILNKVKSFHPTAGEKKEFVVVVENNNENHLLEMQALKIHWKGEDALLTSFHDITVHRQSEIATKREARAYDQGKLEIVDTILHNIGNAINSVAIGIGTIQDKVTNNKLTRHFASLANAVKEHQDDFSDYVKNNPQGQKVAPFIVALADNFVEHDAELSKILSRVHERTEHIADIIRTQRIINKQSIYKKSINIKDAIDNAFAVLHDSIKKMNIQIDIDTRNSPKEFSTQESEFHQMLVNLIKNSVEALGELISSQGMNDKPFIKVSCHTEDKNIILQVADNGIGIEKEKLEVIFRSGYTTKEHGSGLGLHSIANFVNGCDGSIVAISDGIGKGGIMKVKLPLL